MFDLIIGKAGTGKTTELIKKSAETGIYILTSTKKRAFEVFRMARELKIDIPMPVTVEDFIRCGFKGSIIRYKGIYVDDIDDVLQEFFGYIQIQAGTLTIDEMRQNIKIKGEENEKEKP